MNLVIDTDVGSDDATAIILCCAAEKKGNANIWGITCVHGNTSLHNVCANTLKTLHTLCRLDVSQRKYHSLLTLAFSPNVRICKGIISHLGAGIG